ncbi:MAG: hypothetical protein EOM31_11775 [Bacteroidia bacterium]|jgi:hypothetical protein|nr:hypothetical protein [Bacteroidia bacterium]NCC61786.1 hypothetical protein [Verrucomicrobiae bacterium]
MLLVWVYFPKFRIKFNFSINAGGGKILLFFNRSILIIFISFLISTSSYAQDWIVAGKRGIMTFVVVSKEREKDETVYKEAIQSLCTDNDFCKIMFWSNSSDVPTSWPMNEHEKNSKVADYYHNGNSGEVKFIFKYSNDR